MVTSARLMAMSQPPPETGNPVIDAALAQVANAADADLEEQARQLNQAQTVLQEVLRTSRQSTKPQP